MFCLGQAEWTSNMNVFVLKACRWFYLYSYVSKPLAHQMRPGLYPKQNHSVSWQAGRPVIWLSDPAHPALHYPSLLTSLLLLLTPSCSHLQVMLSHVHIPAPTLREGLPTDLTLMRFLSWNRDQLRQRSQKTRCISDNKRMNSRPRRRSPENIKLTLRGCYLRTPHLPQPFNLLYRGQRQEKCIRKA